MRGPTAAIVALLIVIAGLIVSLTVIVPKCCANDVEATVTTFTDGITGHPGGLVAASDGQLYFTEQFDDRVGVFDPKTGKAREIDVPKNTLPHYMIVGPDGGVWFTALSGKIGRLDRASLKVELFSDGITTGAEAHFMVVDPTDDTKFWFTEQRGDLLGRFDTVTKKTTEFRLPPFASPHGLAVGPDKKSLFIAFQGQNSIGKVDLSTPLANQGDFTAAFDEIGGLPAGSFPHDLLFSPDGAYLYATLHGPSQLGRISMADGSVKIYEAFLPKETRNQELNTLVFNKDRTKIVFNMFLSGRIGVLDLASGEVSEAGQELVTTSGPIEVITDQNSTIWATLASLTDKPGAIARIDLKEPT